MRRSEKNIYFSSPPIKSSASPNDENDRPNQQMALNLQKPMKQTVKNFMSPTVSAASKVSFPRKKVLGERNESPGSNSFITHFSKSPVLDSKPSQKIISQKNSPNLDPKEPSSQKTPLSYSSRDGTPSPGPYDPLKNYLSPRPQFLRYNPDRRKEILLRLEMEGKEGDDSIAESDEADTVSSDESESLLEEEDEEDTENEEEEASWSLRGVLKCFLLSVVLISYISSMNSPVSVPAFEAPTLGFQNHSFGIAEGFEAGCKFLDGKEEQLGLLSFTQTMADEVFEEEMTENANSGHLVSLELEDTIVESEEFAENIELQEIEIKTEDVKEDGEDESVKIELQEMEETEEQIEETRDVVEEELVGVLEIEQQGQQTAEEIEFLQVDHQASLLSESSEEIREADEDILKETSDTDMVQVLIMQIRNGMGSAVSVLEKWSKSIALNFQEPLNWLNQHMGTEMFLKVMFGFSTCIAIVASFVFGFSIRRKGIASKPSSLVDKHSTEPVVKEKPSLPLPAERDEPRKLAIPNTMSLVTASAVGRRAPSVELLAEFNIGGISRSVESSAINSRMKDQVSSYSYFSEKDLGSKKDQQGSSELSAVNSNSSERSTSTARKKRLGKELGSNNDAITPVRRSTRIRNCADVISP